MMIGTTVKVVTGEHYGKRGTITSINLAGTGDATTVVLSVTLEPGLVITGKGPDFTPVPIKG